MIQTIKDLEAIKCRLPELKYGKQQELDTESGILFEGAYVSSEEEGVSLVWLSLDKIRVAL